MPPSLRTGCIRVGVWNQNRERNRVSLELEQLRKAHIKLPASATGNSALKPKRLPLYAHIGAADDVRRLKIFYACDFYFDHDGPRERS